MVCEISLKFVTHGWSANYSYVWHCMNSRMQNDECKSKWYSITNTRVSGRIFKKKKSPPKFDDQEKGTFQSDNSILPSMVLYSHFQISVLFTVFFYVVAIRTYQNNIFCFNNWTFCTLTLIYIDILFRCWSRIFTDYVLPQPIKEKTPNAKKVFFQFLAK